MMRKTDFFHGKKRDSRARKREKAMKKRDRNRNSKGNIELLQQ